MRTAQSEEEVFMRRIRLPNWTTSDLPMVAVGKRCWWDKRPRGLTPRLDVNA